MVLTAVVLDRIRNIYAGRRCVLMYPRTRDANDNCVNGVALCSENGAENGSIDSLLGNLKSGKNATKRMTYEGVAALYLTRLRVFL